MGYAVMSDDKVVPLKLQLTQTKSITDENYIEKSTNIGNFKYKRTYNTNEPIDFGDDDKIDNKINNYTFYHILRLLFPDKTPFYWMGMHLILIYFYFIFSPVENLLSYEEYASKCGSMYFKSETLLLWSHFITNALVYIFTMLIRIIFMCIVTNIIKIRSFFALALYRFFDSELSYLLWTLVMYIFLQRSLIKDNHNYHSELLNILFNSKFTFNDRSGTWMFSIQKLYMMLSIRLLLLSSCMLIFELKFISNFGVELKSYLEKYIQLRTFNLAWLTHILKQANDNSDQGRNIKQIVELLSILDPTKKLQPKCEKILNFDTQTFSFFRKNSILDFGCSANQKNKEKDEIFILKNTSLIGTDKGSLFTWNAIEYIVNNPPYISLLTNNVKLIDSTSIKLACDTLFLQIRETCNLYKQNNDIDSLNTQERELSFGSSEHLERDFKDVNQIELSAPDTQLNIDTIIQFMPIDTAAKFINSYDLAGHGYITLHMFMRNVADLTKLRTDLIKNLINQKSIVILVRRLIYTILWFVTLALAGLILKISSNVVLPSTVGFFSTAILALSYLYTKFITAIIFVVLSCPYHVGDRVRVNNGEAMFVKRIRTYTTEFQCVHGKPIIYQNANLSTMDITNETRSNPAYLQFDINIGASVNAAMLKVLKQNISNYVSCRPREFVKNSCEFFGIYLEPGHLYRLTIRTQCTSGWVCARNIGLHKKLLCDFIAHQCKILGITYQSPQKNITFANPLSLVK